MYPPPPGPRPPRPHWTRTSVPLFITVLIATGAMLFGCVSGFAIGMTPPPEETSAAAARSAPPTPSTSATASPAAATPTPAEPWEKIPDADRKAFITALGAADPGLVDGENQIKRGLRRAVTTCRDIEKDRLEGTKLAIYISQHFSGGHGHVSIAEGRQLDKAIRRWICAPLGLATAKPSPAPTRSTSAPPKRTATPRPRTTPTRAPAPQADPRFSTCSKANAAGYGPYRRGVDREYSWYQDRDGDGVVCES